MNIDPRNLLVQLPDGVAAMVARLDGAEIDDEFRDQVLEWLASYRAARGLSSLTLCRYGDILREYLGRWLLDQELHPEQPTHADMERWMRHLYVERALQASSRQQHLAAVRGWYRWRRANGRGVADPTEHLASPKRPRRAPNKFSTAELRRLFDAARDSRCGARDLALLATAYATGAREQELQRISLSDIVLGKRVATVRFCGKGAKEREVTFEGAAVQALHDWLLVRDQLPEIHDPEAVWICMKSRHNGQRLGKPGIRQIMSRHARHARLSREGIHTLRSTFATDLFDQGEPIEVIQQLMGHEKVETTRGYIVITERYRKTRMSSVRLDSVINGDAAASAPLWAKTKVGMG